MIRRKRELNKIKLAIVKSDLIKELADNYPNFLRKDLIKLVDITIIEIQNSLKRGERVELRDIFTLDPRIQKEGIRRNPKTGEKVFVKEKKSVLFKMSKEWAKKLNEED
tara:strand:- start:373 stop:699 length:327 start_codon:yes stop_codon:yes gene_type:complete